ncbi:MAG: class C beta-lactamase-related serine hydrolase, partial [Gemmatimonadetes bacterium]|nr:class C beta-lactamase-related serine hydrolase [Gemmatimonadota bacterium]
GSGAHKDMQLESWSMAKSLTATLYGRLLQMGKVPALSEPAPIPEWQNSPDDPRAAIRVMDLLHMSSGILFTGGESTPEQLAQAFIPGTEDHLLGYQAPIDIFKFSASRPQEFPPNTVGRYRNSDPWLVGSIVRRTVEAMGQEYLTWPQRELFDKIGIRRFVAETDAYGNFILSGYNFGTARDWARFGLLYLNGGVWNGERLLPQSFVEFVHTPAPAWPQHEYGGFFWLNTADASDPRRGGRLPTLPPDTYLASGAGDQSTYIVSSRELVIVVMSHRGRASRARDERETRALGMIVKAVDPGWSWAETSSR